MRQPPGVWVAVLTLVGLAVFVPSTARAHDNHMVGNLTITLGWAVEPAYVGVLNGVEVTIADADGLPPDGLEASLAVDVGFGAESVSLALDPTQGPGRFVAPLMPTRPGVYTFTISGRVNDEQLTITSPCGAATFDCVADVADLQFPERDPSNGELAARLERAPSAPATMDAGGPSPLAGAHIPCGVAPRRPTTW